jgi:hypothetical protein
MQRVLPKTMQLLFFVLLCGMPSIIAQETGSNQQDSMQKLQTRMDELRAQMAQIQAELDAMHGVNNLTNAVNDVKPVLESVQTGSIERTLPSLPPAVQLTPEQQHMAVGKERPSMSRLRRSRSLRRASTTFRLRPRCPASLSCQARRLCCVSMEI